jgi:hypothetical protein
MGKWPYNGHRDAYDMGWAHGTEDIGFPFKYRWREEDINLNINEQADYKQGYRDARRNWD